MTNWLVRKTNGSDVNGGTSLTVRSTGTDGIVNTTAGTTFVTSISAAWTGADVGHGINVGGIQGRWRLISAVTAQSTATVTTTNGSPTITSSAAFTSAMVGQAVTGPGIPPNTVITVFTNSSSMTMSNNAGVGFGTGLATFYVKLTTTGNVAFTAGVTQGWTVGGSWATIQNSVGANTPVVNGDSIYIGAGIYREQVSVAVTPTWTSNVNIIGDVDGSVTTDPGEVRIMGHLLGDVTNTLVGTGTPMNLNSKNFMSFSNIVFVSQSGASSLGTVTNIHDISFTDCAFFTDGGFVFSGTMASAAASNLTWDRCYFYIGVGSTCISFTLPSTASGGADYNANVLVRNSICLCLGNVASSYFVSVSGSGAAAFLGGGVTVRGNSVFGIGILRTTGVGQAGTSTGIPCNAFENVCWGYTAANPLVAAITDNILEDYNVNFSSTTIRSGITASAAPHDHANGTADFTMFSMGHERIWGAIPRLFGTPLADSFLTNWGSSTTGTAPTTDILNRPRIAGTSRLVASGTATSSGIYPRTDAATVNNGSASIADVSITAADFGMLVTGTGIPNQSFVGTVVPGVSFTLSSSPIISTSVNANNSGASIVISNNNILVDTAASFPNGNALNGAVIKLTGGTGSGQYRAIKLSTNTMLTTFANWQTNPDNTSTYQIYYGNYGDAGQATSATGTTLVNLNASWNVSQWMGWTVEIMSGTGSTQARTITSSTSNTLTISAAWGTNPDSTSVYNIYRKKPAAINGIDVAGNNTVGAYARHDTASRETVLTDAGGVAWRITGWGDQEIKIPVDATPTAITVKCSFDTDHGNTNKPQAILLADAAIGVTGQTLTATGTAGSGTFETLTFSTITPTAKSWVVVRFSSRSDKVTGRAIFDSVTVT